MRLRCAACALLLALTACGTTTHRQTHPRAADCGPTAGRTLAASTLARVYALRANVYGCALGAHHSRLLGAAGHSVRQDRVGPTAVAGRDAGYGLTSFGVDTVTAEVIVRNLGSGRQLHVLPATTRVQPESFQTVDGVVVRADGAVAWISSVTSVFSHGAPLVQVQRADSRGHAVLDSAPSIDARSLHLTGSTVSWKDGSRTHTATLR